MLIDISVSFWGIRPIVHKNSPPNYWGQGDARLKKYRLT